MIVEPPLTCELSDYDPMGSSESHQMSRRLFSFGRRTSLSQIHDQVHGKKENQRSPPYNRQAVEQNVIYSKLRDTWRK